MFLHTALLLLPSANIFQPLIDVFEAVLKFYHRLIGGSWGWSIVLLTITVRAVLVPLTVKQIRSMARMQQLQPEMKAIQAKYKDDKQRQQQEMMKFYKENNVNPLGSCLPLVAQLPVFISLYYMLRQSLRIDICPTTQLHYKAAYAAAHHISLAAAAGQTTPCGPNNGAGFLFISDLTNKATGITLVVLIVLYVATQLGSSLMMSGATMDRTQRNIMLFMPLVFVLFVIRFPAGVLVYWITTNLWTVCQQYIVKRRMGPIRAATAAAGAAGAVVAATDSTTKSKPSASRPKPDGRSAQPEPNGSGTGGGLSGLLRKARPAEDQKQPVSAVARTGPPPKPPRKKKKRSGRRR
jgi:YidC/Oxa1 family membrane protein insertase